MSHAQVNTPSYSKRSKFFLTDFQQLIGDYQTSGQHLLITSLTGLRAKRLTKPKRYSQQDTALAIEKLFVRIGLTGRIYTINESNVPPIKTSSKGKKRIKKRDKLVSERFYR